MSKYQFAWPEKKDQREDVLAQMMGQGRGIRNHHSIKWWIANLYMQGFREFSNINYQNGTVSVSYLDESGIMKYRHDEIVAKYMTQLGRLMAVDLAPKVSRKGISLDGMRKASVAQVVLDAAFPSDKVDALKTALVSPLLMYGTLALGLWSESEDSHGIEVIMPWEIMPIPVDATGHTGRRGLIRFRPVPVDWIKRLVITPGKRSKEYNNPDSMMIPAGNMPVDIDTMQEGILSTTSGGGGYFIRTQPGKDEQSGMGRRKSKDKTKIPVTLLVETWTETPDGYLADYGIYMGLSKFKELYRRDHSQEKYPMPVRVVGDIPTGSFWSRSFVDTLIPLNNEIEYAMSSMFQAIVDFDLYGFQLWPTTLGEPAEAERGQDGIKRLRYEPDYTCPELKPDSVMPTKMTAPMIQSINVATSMMDRVANQPSKITSGEAPGRTDSSAALSFLYEASSVPLSPTAKHIAMGVAGVYRSLLRILKDQWTDQKVVSISNMDDSLAGIVVDAKTGQMQLSANTIPYPDEVEIRVASELPVSKAQMREELKEALAGQRITIDEYNQQVRIQGLDLPVGDELGWQSYRRAMLENIILFGDGQKPGKVIVSDYDVGRIHTQVLLTFMARPEFQLASAEVRGAFQEHLTEHRTNAGAMPEQMPYMEEAAEGLLGEGTLMQGLPPQAL